MDNQQNNNAPYHAQEYIDHPPMDVMCVVSFCVSVFAGITCGVLSGISLILSIIGLVKVRKNGKRGKGLAIAGIIISSVSLVILIIMFILIFSVGVLSGLKDYSSRQTVVRHNEEIAAQIDDEDGQYVKGFGSYDVDEEWMEADASDADQMYIYCLRGTYDPSSDEVPNNIMVSHGTNFYSEAEHMDFKNAILRQLNDQIKGTDVEEITGSGYTSGNGYTVYRFNMTGGDTEQIQFYIVGDREYVLVSAMVWDKDAAEDDDIVSVAEEIVDSFEWA